MSKWVRVTLIGGPLTGCVWGVASSFRHNSKAAQFSYWLMTNQCIQVSGACTRLWWRICVIPPSV